MTQAKPWLIVGLGNPGTQYQATRHNVGRQTVERLAADTQQNFRRDRSGLMVADAFLGPGPGQGRVYVSYPTTYMNISGPPVATFARKLGIAPAQIIVVHDDLDLAPHLLRLKIGGGEGGHNGLRSISSALGTRDYARLRIGVGRPIGRMDAASFVLAKIPKADLEEWAVTEAQAADVLNDLVRDGFVAAQQDLHSRV